MKYSRLLFLILMLVVITFSGISYCAEEINLAHGKSVVSLPVANFDTEFYQNITDGDLTSYGDLKGWVKYAYLVVDLEKIDYIDEVKIHCSNVNDYFAGWYNLKPHLAVYVGESLDSLHFVAEKIPSRNYEHVSAEDIKKPYVSFNNLREHGRYVVIYCFRGWGVKLHEIEVLKYDKAHTASEAVKESIALKDLWRNNVSLSGLLPMSTKVVTPHINWLQPAATGPVKALFFMHKGQFRVIAELEQRMQMEWDWVPLLWNSSQDKPAVSPMNILEEQSTLEKLKIDYDVIVLCASVKWAELPKSVRTVIMDKVAAGAGLIYVDPLEECLLPEMQSVLSDMGETEALSEIFAQKYALRSVKYMKPLPQDFISIRAHGVGDVALLKYNTFLKKERWNFCGTGMMPEFYPYKMMPSPVENYYAFMINLMNRVSGKVSPLRITNVESKSGELYVQFDKSTLPEMIAAGLSVYCELRDKQYNRYATYSSTLADTVRISKAENNLCVKIPIQAITPKLRKGDNFINIWIKDSMGNVFDYAVLPVAGTEPGIASVNINSAGYDKHGGDFSVALDGKKSGSILTAKAFDAYNRLVWKDEQEAVNGSATFNLNSSSMLGYALNLEVTLKQKEMVIDVAYAVVPCGLNQVKDVNKNYSFDVWGEAPWRFSKPWAQYILKQQREAGVDGTTAYANYYASQNLTNEEWDKLLDDFFANFTLAGLRPIYQYSAGVLNYCARAVNNRLWHPKSEEESNMILGDPAFTEQYIDNVQQNADVGTKWGIYSYSSGDEQQGWMSYHEKNIAAFRQYMQDKYKDIKLLNKTWGSDYSSFAEIKPTKLGNIGEGLSRSEMEEGRGYFKLIESDERLKAVRGEELYSLAPWLEYRLFMDHLFINVHGQTMQALAKSHPGTRFGLDGTRFAGAIGFNWPKLLRNVNDIVCYNESVQAEVIRDYASKETHTASFVGYDTHDTDELWSYMRSWRDLIRGLKGVNYYAASGYRGAKTAPHHRFGLVAEDLQLSHSGKIHSEQIKQIKKGIGPLIMHADHAPYSAVIRYSQPSLAVGDYIGKHTQRYLSNRYFAAPTAVHELQSAERMMIDLGINWRYVTDSELGEEFLKKHPEINLVYIPFGVCISEQEIENLVAFMEGGGTVVTTGEFAVLNNNGRIHSKDYRNQLFGVISKNNEWIRSGGKKSTIQFMALKSDELEIPVLFNELAVKDGNTITQFSNNIPAIVIKAHGAGKAVFINSYIGIYKAYLPVYIPGPYHNPSARRESMARAYRNLFRSAVSNLDLNRAVKISTAYYPEENAPYYRIGKYVNPDGGTIYGLIQVHMRRDYYIVNDSLMRIGEGLDCTLNFDTTGHIYDVRKQMYLGYGNKIKDNIYPCEAKIYAIMPYQLIDVALDFPATVKPGKELVIKVAVKTAGKKSRNQRSAIVIELYAPDGIEVEHYMQNIIVDGTKGSCTMRFALNDKSGIWRIKATDTVTGIHADKFIKVE